MRLNHIFKPIHLAVLVTVLTSTVHAQLPTHIALASTDWCPYACETATAQHGIVYDYITQVLKQQDIAVDIRFYPWSRAIGLANIGDTIHGLLTAVKAEAPNLLFTTTPIMSYQICFFSKPKKNWMYEGVDSLAGMRIGVISGYGYGSPLDEYINDPANRQFISTINGNNGVSRLISQLHIERIETFVEDKNVVQWTTRQYHLNTRSLKPSNCLSDNPFYLAIHTDLPGSQELITLLNRELAAPNNIALLNKITQQYLAN